ncbi:hypothetical protein Hanom_Chr16g01420981 [Helianthus anomalus]
MLFGLTGTELITITINLHLSVQQYCLVYLGFDHHKSLLLHSKDIPRPPP